jgi:CheY-like chemotaxis protein
MKKILVVDDIEGWRNYHSQVLRNIFSGDCEIHTADSARAGYDKLLEHHDKPFDIIITDLQMESDFEPKYAGEWFVEQIKTFKNYYKTKIIIISATYNINVIADNLGVFYIRKITARNFPNSYRELVV